MITPAQSKTMLFGSAHSTESGSNSWPDIDQLSSALAIDPPSTEGWYVAGKVIVDYLFALLLLPLVLLFLAIMAVAVKLTSPGPVFYTQTRSGLGGKRYKIIKIRTMHHNCEMRSGIVWAGNNDSRVTRIGKLLRKTHLDELPQLFNVLKGEMSLVGPRPERPEVIAAKGLEEIVPGYRHRLSIRPGVTGFAQLQIPADSDLTSVRHKVVYDLYYIRNQSLLFDLRLILATILKAAGFGPNTIRTVFLLPNRDQVAASFLEQFVEDELAAAQLQPCLN